MQSEFEVILSCAAERLPERKDTICHAENLVEQSYRGCTIYLYDPQRLNAESRIGVFQNAAWIDAELGLCFTKYGYGAISGAAPDTVWFWDAQGLTQEVLFGYIQELIDRNRRPFQGFRRMFVQRFGARSIEPSNRVGKKPLEFGIKWLILIPVCGILLSQIKNTKISKTNCVTKYEKRGRT